MPNVIYLGDRDSNLFLPAAMTDVPVKKGEIFNVSGRDAALLIARGVVALVADEVIVEEDDPNEGKRERLFADYMNKTRDALELEMKTLGHSTDEITGTGAGGNVIKEDIANYLADLFARS